jgi:hypothetical protein
MIASPSSVRLGVGLIVAYCLVVCIGTHWAGRRWVRNQVPPQWQPGRWETTREGTEVRRLVEGACGQLPEGVWLDRSNGLASVKVIGPIGSEQRQCAEGLLEKWLASQ